MASVVSHCIGVTPSREVTPPASPASGIPVIWKREPSRKIHWSKATRSNNFPSILAALEVTKATRDTSMATWVSRRSSWV